MFHQGVPIHIQLSSWMWQVGTLPKRCVGDRNIQYHLLETIRMVSKMLYCLDQLWNASTTKFLKISWFLLFSQPISQSNFYSANIQYPRCSSWTDGGFVTDKRHSRSHPPWNKVVLAHLGMLNCVFTTTNLWLKHRHWTHARYYREMWYVLSLTREQLYWNLHQGAWSSIAMPRQYVLWEEDYCWRLWIAIWCKYTIGISHKSPCKFV